MNFNVTVLPQSGKVLATLATDMNMTYVTWFRPSGEVVCYIQHYGSDDYDQHK